MNEMRPAAAGPSAATWSRRDYSRVPHALYHDPELYRLEQERIFRGPVWQFLGLEADVQKSGDFRTSWLGDTPVIYNRAADGRIHAFVNRCAHRGAMVRRETYGRTDEHVCVYHRWRYDLEGNLTGVPFRRGVGGHGGLSPEFDPAQHGLQKVHLASVAGVLFATFADNTPPLEDYLGKPLMDHITRTVRGPVKILGYQRQRIFGNWKLYAENVRDQYHGSLLHQFQGAFISKITTVAGSFMDPRHRHNIIYSRPWTAADGPANNQYSAADVQHQHATLKDDAMLKVRHEFPDQYGSTICSIFPNATLQQIRNSLAFRQIRTKGQGEFELFWTYFGFTDDDEEMTHHRLLQANMAGPCGYVSMEDGEAIEITHRATGTSDAESVIEMGGNGPLVQHVQTRINDLAIRGFWSFYSELMGMEPPGAVR